MRVVFCPQQTKGCDTAQTCGTNISTIPKTDHGQYFRERAQGCDRTCRGSNVIMLYVIIVVVTTSIQLGQLHNDHQKSQLSFTYTLPFFHFTFTSKPK